MIVSPGVGSPTVDFLPSCRPVYRLHVDTHGVHIFPHGLWSSCLSSSCYIHQQYSFRYDLCALRSVSSHAHTNSVISRYSFRCLCYFCCPQIYSFRGQQMANRGNKTVLSAKPECYSQRLHTAICYNAKGRIPIFILIG